MFRNKIYQHDGLQPWPLPDKSVDVIITSPPYWGLRDYLHADQIGQEQTPEGFINHMVQVFSEGWRVLKDTGTLWLNLGDTYWGGKGQSGGAWQGDHINAGAQNWSKKGHTRPQDRRHDIIKPKDLVGIPWEVALALRRAGWYLRQDVIWNKPNPMPESMDDRCTKSHEYLFMLTKSREYYFDAEAIKEAANYDGRKDMLMKGSIKYEGAVMPGGKPQGLAQNGHVRWKQNSDGEFVRNKRSVWTVPTMGFDGEFCTACRRYYAGKEKSAIKVKMEMEDGREVKRSYCLCGRYDAWVAHFACFPEKLIVDCVKASTSQHGNCVECGKPWERITEPIMEVAHTGDTNTNYDTTTMSAGRLAKLRQAARENGQEYTSAKKTVGWKRTCACTTEEVVKPVVADNFMGAGTTALVALAQGRDFVGLELNSDYIDLARHRIRHNFGMFFTL